MVDVVPVAVAIRAGVVVGTTSGTVVLGLGGAVVVDPMGKVDEVVVVLVVTGKVVLAPLAQAAVWPTWANMSVRLPAFPGGADLRAKSTW